MKSTIVIALLALSLAAAASAQTLCQKGEMDHLSCPTGGGRKILSICSNIEGSTIDEGSWLQYRFGKPGKIELAFPEEKTGSISKFEGNYFNPREQPASIADLRFTSGGSHYGVTLTSVASKKGVSAFYGGVSVELGRNRRISIECDRVDGPRYFDGFRELNHSLPARK